MLPTALLNRLLGPLALGALFAILGVVALLFAEDHLNATQLAEQRAAAERRDMQSKLTRATQEEREIRDRLIDYRRLLDRGVIGAEQRLDWIEAIAKVRNANQLLDLKYSIAPQASLDYPGIAKTGDVELLMSQMKVDLSLLHEGDLFRFLAALRRELRSHVSVRACNVQRIERAVSEKGPAPRLRAECTLDLVTIRDRMQEKRS